MRPLYGHRPAKLYSIYIAFDFSIFLYRPFFAQFKRAATTLKCVHQFENWS